jgi:hypothetical protein
MSLGPLCRILTKLVHYSCSRCCVDHLCVQLDKSLARTMIKLCTVTSDLLSTVSSCMQTLEDDDDYYLWDEGGRPCIPAPGSRLDEAVQDVLCVPEWQEEGIPTKSKQGNFLDSKAAF